MSSKQVNIVRQNGRKHGEVFTNKNVIEFLLDEVGYVINEDLSNKRILEPASGTGAFAKEIIRRLYFSSKRFNFSFLNALEANVRLVELNIESFNNLVSSISEYASSLDAEFSVVNTSIFIQGDFLTLTFTNKFDCVVGNPPYIRHELIDDEKRELYRKEFSTFKYRADLYIAFYERSLSLLNKSGLLSFICSNRWLYNQYGKPLRTLISKSYGLNKILNIEKASPFDEDVIAYPCITTISNKVSKDVLVFESDEKTIDFNSINYKKIINPIDGNWECVFLDYDLDNTSLSGILDQGFSIGIGVATGADKIFILDKERINGIEKSRLLPIVNTKDLTSKDIEWKGKYVINPFVSGELCDLNNFPHLKDYFESHKETLLKRHVSKKYPNKWYKTIDKIKDNLMGKPKLLIPDMNGKKKIIYDDGGFYPHHNLYYITGEDPTSLKALGALLISNFVDKQISKIAVRMNGGLVRFQSQTLKKLKIPTINSFSNFTRKELALLFDQKDIKGIDVLIQQHLEFQNTEVETFVEINNRLSI